MDIIDSQNSLPEYHNGKQSDDSTQHELFTIISRLQTTIHNQTLKKMIADCLSSDHDFWKYIEQNNIDLRDQDFITAVQQRASSIHTFPEQKLLLQIAEAFAPCCHAQCGTAFCSSSVVRESLRIQNLSFDDKISLLNTAIQSRHISRSRRERILQALLPRLLAESELDKLQQVYTILQNTQWSDIWNIKFGPSDRRNRDRDIFLTIHRKDFKDKIDSLQ